MRGTFFVENNVFRDALKITLADYEQKRGTNMPVKTHAHVHTHPSYYILFGIRKIDGELVRHPNALLKGGKDFERTAFAISNGCEAVCLIKTTPDHNIKALFAIAKQRLRYCVHKVLSTPVKRTAK